MTAVTATLVVYTERYDRAQDRANDVYNSDVATTGPVAGRATSHHQWGQAIVDAALRAIVDALLSMRLVRCHRVGGCLSD